MQTEQLDVKHRWGKWNLTIAIVLSLWMVVSNSRFLIEKAVNEQSAWNTGDWLIDYSGGLIRRGFLGELVGLVTSSGEQAVVLVTALQIASLVIVAATAIVLFASTNRSPGWLMLVMSPAFLLFPLFNEEGAVRKEILVILAVALFAVIVRFLLPSWLVAFPLTIFSIGSLSHEAVALCAFAFVGFAWLAHRHGKISLPVRNITVSILSLAGITGIVIPLLFPGTLDQQEAICTSFKLNGLPYLCEGPLTFMNDSFTTAVGEVVALFPGYLTYLTPLILSLVPFYILRVPKQVVLLFVLTYVTLAPLFVTGVDFGRWIYLATAIMSFVLLGIGNSLKLAEREVPRLVALGFIALWSMPYTGTPNMDSLLTEILRGPITLVFESLARFKP